MWIGMGRISDNILALFAIIHEFSLTIQMHRWIDKLGWINILSTNNGLVVLAVAAYHHLIGNVYVFLYSLTLVSVMIVWAVAAVVVRYSISSLLSLILLWVTSICLLIVSLGGARPERFLRILSNDDIFLSSIWITSLIIHNILRASCIFLGFIMELIDCLLQTTLSWHAIWVSILSCQWLLNTIDVGDVTVLACRKDARYLINNPSVSTTLAIEELLLTDIHVSLVIQAQTMRLPQIGLTSLSMSRFLTTKKQWIWIQNRKKGTYSLWRDLFTDALL